MSSDGSGESEQDVDATMSEIDEDQQVPVARQQAINLVGTLLNRRYKLTALIGQGGMADVYRGEDIKLHKQLAVKVLSPEQQRKASVVERFLLEARAASRVRHPHVVDITDFGVTPERLTFFAMEYLDGEDLQDTLRREGTLEWERARDVTLQILDACQAAHDAGLIHRDMKPHNCFRITRDGNPDYVKLIDFGLAKLQDADATGGLTGTGVIMGTAHYMSPEQGMGSKVDHRCDIYAVGAMMFQMLTGQVPYDGHSAMSILYKHIHAELPRLSDAKPDVRVPAAVESVIHKAMAKDPDARFSTASEFAAAVRSVDGVPEWSGATRRPTNLDLQVGAKKPAPSSKLPLVIGLAGVGALALAVVLVLSPWRTPEPTLSASVATPVNDSPPERNQASDPAPKPTPEATQPPPLPQPTAPVEPAESGTAVTEATTTREGDEEQDGDEPGSAEKSDGPAGPRTGKKMARALERTGSAVSACGKQAGLFPGEKVAVEVEVSASGQVTKAAVTDGQVTSAGRACIEKAVKRAKMGRGTEQKTTHRFTI